VRTGELTIRGPRSATDIRRRVRSVLTSVRSCAESSPLSDDGRVVFELDLDEDGRPTQVSAISSTFDDDAHFEGCAVRALRNVDFGPADAGSRVEYALVLDVTP
jgi:hypothetical protein